MIQPKISIHVLRERINFTHNSWLRQHFAAILPQYRPQCISRPKIESERTSFDPIWTLNKRKVDVFKFIVLSLYKHLRFAFSLFIWERISKYWHDLIDTSYFVITAFADKRLLSSVWVQRMSFILRKKDQTFISENLLIVYSNKLNLSC